MTNDIVSAQPTGGALSAEHYQTFELAKENDTVLGGDNIAQIRSYAAYARAQAQAIHKTIAATSGIDDVAAIKQEALETEQTFAKVGIYADQRIGEILRELPKAKNQHDVSDLPMGKTQTIKDAGFTPKTASQLEQLAANPDVVQAVLDRAESEGRIPSRQQVLDAIRERNEAREDAEGYAEEIKDMQEEIAALEKQADKAYEDGYNAATRSAQPRVVERVVESDAAKKRISELEHERDVYLSDVQKLRKRNEDMRRKLEQANALIGEKQRNDSAEWDIAALTTATNNYLRQYGGRAWAFDQLYRVDETTQTEFTKAISNLAAFATNLAQMIKEQTNE